jgi:hypothetical protein
MERGGAEHNRCPPPPVAPPPPGAPTPVQAQRREGTQNQETLAASPDAAVLAMAPPLRALPPVVQRRRNRPNKRQRAMRRKFGGRARATPSAVGDLASPRLPLPHRGTRATAPPRAFWRVFQRLASSTSTCRASRSVTSVSPLLWAPTKLPRPTRHLPRALSTLPSWRRAPRGTRPPPPPRGAPVRASWGMPHSRRRRR